MPETQISGTSDFPPEGPPDRRRQRRVLRTIFDFHDENDISRHASPAIQYVFDRRKTESCEHTKDRSACAASTQPRLVAPAAQPHRMVPYGRWGCRCQQSSARSSRTTREIIMYLKHSSQKAAIKNALSDATANIFHPFLSLCRNHRWDETVAARDTWLPASV